RGCSHRGDEDSGRAREAFGRGNHGGTLGMVFEERHGQTERQTEKEVKRARPVCDHRASPNHSTYLGGQMTRKKLAPSPSTEPEKTYEQRRTDPQGGAHGR